ncbi:hypothetical protein SNL152K_3832 [Streptomyces sp. NL15-2K]|nr:hypothetical protein SNL152K_3832 [Streptomyces sp. NL15-2K]
MDGRLASLGSAVRRRRRIGHRVSDDTRPAQDDRSDGQPGPSLETERSVRTGTARTHYPTPRKMVTNTPPVTQVALAQRTDVAKCHRWCGPGEPEAMIQR